MKQQLLLLSMAVCLFCSCGTNTSSGTAEKMHHRTASDTCSQCPEYMPTDTANIMLKSYLASINSGANDTNLHALIFNANCLRSYLSDSTIVNVKIMFAHTMAYIDSGHAGQNCGYTSGDLTLIIAGYDSNNNYVMHNQNMVLEYASPCPQDCPVSGTASNDLLPQ
jgi:hypothetical protein